MSGYKFTVRLFEKCIPNATQTSLNCIRNYQAGGSNFIVFVLASVMTVPPLHSINIRHTANVVRIVCCQSDNGSGKRVRERKERKESGKRVRAERGSSGKRVRSP